MLRVCMQSASTYLQRIFVSYQLLRLPIYQCIIKLCSAVSYCLRRCPTKTPGRIFPFHTRSETQARQPRPSIREPWRTELMVAMPGRQPQCRRKILQLQVAAYSQGPNTDPLQNRRYARAWRRNVSQWDGSSRPTFKSGTARNAFCRPTFWPQTAYCTYEGDVKIH